MSGLSLLICLHFRKRWRLYAAQGDRESDMRRAVPTTMTLVDAKLLSATSYQLMVSKNICWVISLDLVRRIYAS